MEWVEDCWHSNYGDEIIPAPADGSAWNTGCSPESRVVGIGGVPRLETILEPGIRRGGGWRSTSDAQALRSANRTFETTSTRVNDTGFRVARMVLAPEIVTLQNDSFMLLRGDSELAMVEVPVTINVDPDTDPITNGITNRHWRRISGVHNTLRDYNFPSCHRQQYAENGNIYTCGRRHR